MKIYIITDQTAYILEIQYICKLFSSILDAEILVQDPSSPMEKDKAYIAYCREEHLRLMPDFCRIKIIRNHLFWEQYIAKTCPKLDTIKIEDVCVFGASDDRPKFEFELSGITTNLDLFSSAFFLITRIEESYGKGDLDAHGRYQFCNSIVGENLVKQPLVNLYAKALADWIKKAYGIELPLREKTMCAVITHDIDAPYYYLTFKAEISKIVNSLWSKKGKYTNLGDLINYILFLLGIGADPCYVFDYMTETEERRNIKSTYFILAEIWGLKKKRYAKQLRRLRSLGYEIALHPGYNSFSETKKISHEKKTVEKLSGVEPKGTRNHFLRFDVPGTYKRFEEMNLLYDSTMGYAEHEGFRAGICTPFKPFDINNHQIIDLIEIPLAVMDSTLINYRDFQPDEALENIKELVNNVYEVQGMIVFNWHNHLLTDSHAGWRSVYEKSLDYLLDKNASFYTCAELAKKWKRYWV